jgi:uncharacterized protein YndB with AHSA1/START domain
MKKTLKVEVLNDLEVRMTRDFDAPRPRVWETMAKPDLLKRWLFGPPGWEMTVCEDDPRVGGAFRWSWSGPDGADLTMTGVYHEVVPPERSVRTEVFQSGSMPPMGEQLATLVLTERGGETTLTITLRYASKEARDGAMASGMEHGVSAGYDRLEEILRTDST